MKKKNVLMMALSLALVAVIAVGGTLAYLSDTTGEVTNTFRFTANGIDLTLAETADDGDGYTVDNSSAAESGGLNYTDILPGAVIDKNPQLTVENTSASDCYVYALVEGISNVPAVDTATTPLMWTTWGDSWTVVATGTAGTLLRYTNEGTKDIVTSTMFGTPLADIFTSVQVNPNLVYDEDSSINFDDVVITGYAAQASMGKDSADAAAKAEFGFMA